MEEKGSISRISVCYAKENWGEPVKGTTGNDNRIPKTNQMQPEKDLI